MKIITIILLFCVCCSTLYSQYDYTEVDRYVVEYEDEVNSIKGLWQFLDSIDNRYDEDLSKIRSIYIWSVKNISYDYVKLKKIINKENLEIYGTSIVDRCSYVLKRKKGVCEDYSRLFKLMGGYLDLEIGYVSGCARSHSDTDIDLENIEITSKHAWNFVCYNNVNYFVDATWGVNDSLTNYEPYFLVLPNKMITTHFPNDEDWQYVKEKLSLDEFKKLPYVYETYKEDYYVLDFFPKKNVMLERENNNFRLGVKIHDKCRSSYTLILKDDIDGNILKSASLVNRNGYLVINYIVERSKNLKELYVYLKKNDEDEKKLIRYNIK